MAYDAAMAQPIILFGAFDRHNFGDLLFPHVAAALLPGRELVFAGLASRDLRACGGHQVHALTQLAADWDQRPAALIHVGGEILTCSAWQAAVMLQPPDELQSTLTYLAARPQEQAAWVQHMVGSTALAPYTLTRSLFPALTWVSYLPAGGVQLDVCEPALRAEVLANLQAADAVSVRDGQTLAQLAAAGITAQLLPDPAVMVAELFGERIHQRAAGGEMAQVLRTFPQGYLAVQFSSDFGDDATLATIAHQLDQAAAASGFGVVLFRAGAAPWHDDLAGLQHVAARMRTPAVQVAESLDIWDICALIAHSRAYCGSSLHGRIVAMAYALPRVNLIPPAASRPASKQAAFAATWEDAGTPCAVGADGITAGIQQALGLKRTALQGCARRLVTQYRHGFETLCPRPATGSTAPAPPSHPSSASRT